MKIPTATRPRELQLAIGHVDGWAGADGVVHNVSETELQSFSLICGIVAECNMSWTLTPTGGDLVGDNGERFAIVFRGSLSLPVLHKNELERLRVHEEQIWRCLTTLIGVAPEATSESARSAATLPLSSGGLGCRSSVRLRCATH